MPRRVVSALVSLVFAGVVVSACSSPAPAPAVVQPSETPPAPTADVGHPADASPPESVRDAGPDTGIAIDPAFPHGHCADTFGDALSAGFGRIDGILHAVVAPEDTKCALPNNDHIVLQVLMNKKVYRLVASLGSTRAGVDPRMRFASLNAPLPSPAWAEGWHLGVAIDYPSTLMLHTDAFTPYEQPALVTALLGELKIGEQVSVYATSGQGRPESAHLIHRNGGNADGAIVLHPTTATPRFLVFHFDGQAF